MPSCVSGAVWRYSEELRRLRGELWEQAVVYLRQAGLRAMAQAAYREAIAHLEQALGALRRLPETRQTTALTIDLHLDLRNALAGELGMRPLVAHCHLGLGTLYIKTGRQEQARTELSTAMAMYRAMEMAFWLPQTEAALTQVEGR